jgi:hypothetical protein
MVATIARPSTWKRKNNRTFSLSSLLLSSFSQVQVSEKTLAKAVNQQQPERNENAIELHKTIELFIMQ